MLIRLKKFSLTVLMLRKNTADTVNEKKFRIGLALIGFPGILLSKYYCRKVARYSRTSNICQNLPELLMIRRVRVGSAKLTRRPCPTLNQ